jgi:TIR domain
MNRRRWWPSPQRKAPEPAAPQPQPGRGLISGPAFFLSYARAKASSPREAGGLGDPNRGVKQLYADLNERVRQMLPLRAGEEAGWMDGRLEAGDLWSGELLRNLGKARAFVALLSPPYLQRSEWCAMEWDYFGRRDVRPQNGAARGSPPTAIIPVLWTPLDGTLPSMVAKVQRFMPSPVVTPEHIQLYESEGVLGMSDVNPVAYRAVVWALARQIQETCAALEVAPTVSTSTARLRRSFADGGR